MGVKAERWCRKYHRNAQSTFGLIKFMLTGASALALFVCARYQQFYDFGREQKAEHYAFTGEALNANPGNGRVVQQRLDFSIDHAVWQRMREIQEQEPHL